MGVVYLALPLSGLIVGLFSLEALAACSGEEGEG
jgi:hypothetical protein